MRAGWLVMLIAAVAFTGCTHSGKPRGAKANEQGSGILMGQIVGASETPPLSGVRIKIVKPDGSLAATALTDKHGRYRIVLPAGEYRVERGGGFSGTPRNLPAKVAISPGGKTRLDVWVGPGKG